MFFSDIQELTYKQRSFAALQVEEAVTMAQKGKVKRRATKARGSGRQVVARASFEVGSPSNYLAPSSLCPSSPS